MSRLIVLALLLAPALSARADEIDYKKLYAQTAPAVVLIYGEEGKVGSVGSGSIIRGDGLVVTNAHVILNHDTQKPFEKLFVFMKPDKVTGHNADDLQKGFVAQWLAFSPELDLALLRMVDAPATLPVIELSDDSNVGVGEATAAIGHPENGARWSLTTGRIGGEWADFDGVKGKDVYQMETSVNRGNSGGPLLDGNGHLIGINTSIARRAADGLAITGVNFAIKSHVVRAWIGAANEKIAEAPEVHSALPPATAVAKAQPAPPAQETVPPKDTPAKEPQLATIPPPPPEAKRVTVSQVVPVAAAPKPRGFTSSTKPGKVLTGAELTKEHAKAAFDDMEREAQRATARKGK
ncbi:MAG: trypsin-like peptidase domain-containing protein [Deltaproteobacteria bacterium]|nr:trypsin-like peptidase domain-containing protein [Deltaproteobacteria bacterium]